MSSETIEQLCTQGHVVTDLKCTDQIHDIQDCIKQIFPGDPTLLHQQSIAENDFFNLIKKAKDQLMERQYVKKILQQRTDWLSMLLGPDIDIQTNVHLRVTRPNLESDGVGWHRDTFYGNSYWEVNVWIPIFPLAEGAGLLLLDQSHLTPSQNIQEVPEAERSRIVHKHSLQDELGHAYLPKIDNAIASHQPEHVKLIAPQVGEAVFFFGYMAHRGQNLSSKTRVSVDLRVKSMLGPSQTKPGYYEPLARGPFQQWITRVTEINNC